MLETIFNLALIVLGFGVLIFVHELGHFLAARWAGIRVEAFAVGMGPVMASWRKGIGFRAGSTSRTVEKRINDYYAERGEDTEQFRARIDRDPDFARLKIYQAMDALGIGSTEYSLRWLPIGGFVKMLGQEDANPQATSDLPGSYQNTPIGKRMIVVSAGVIANLVLAFALFIWSFMVGVPDIAPVIGGTAADMPAANAVALNAAEHGIEEPGIHSGDRVLEIDGEEIDAFSDIYIAAAMARGDEPLRVKVERAIEGRATILNFEIMPRKSPEMGLLSFGVSFAHSTMLLDADVEGITDRLDRAGLDEHGIEPGMTLIEAAGQPVEQARELERIVRDSGGEPVETAWVRLTEEGEVIGEPIRAPLPVDPEYQTLYAEYDDAPMLERGLLGFSPLTRVESVMEDTNRGRIEVGDVFLKIGALEAPRSTEFRTYVSEHPGETFEAIVLREGERVPISLEVSRKGRIGIGIELANDLLMTARPITEYRPPRRSTDEPIERISGPLFGEDIWSLTRIFSVDGREVSTWPQFREALLDATRRAFEQEEAATVEFGFELPTPSKDRVAQAIEVDAETIAELHGLRWESVLSNDVFEPLPVLLTADGNPIRAVVMGFEGTWKFLINTYLTIDRLFRGTVGVEQLRGPVGIVHLGTQIADRGFMYLVFFLAMISVNLAVINFLPLPIVDGGLFLFLVYEKIKGRPPSVAFQNWATIAGLVMIAGIFLVVTYNDIARLVFGGV